MSDRVRYSVSPSGTSALFERGRHRIFKITSPGGSWITVTGPQCGQVTVPSGWGLVETPEHAELWAQAEVFG